MKKLKIRTQYLVAPKIQLTMIAIPIITHLICFIIALVFLSIYYQDILNVFKQVGINPEHPIYQYISLQKSKVVYIFALTLMVGFLINIIVLTWVTHKIVGPIYRLRKSMEGLLNNEEIRPVKLRKGDFFSEDAELLEQIRIRGLK